MTHGNVTAEDVDELIEQTATAAKAFIRGDVRTYFELIRQQDDYVLMSPFGGEPQRGPDRSPERSEALQRAFRSGEAELEVVRTFTSADMVVLVAIERQHGEVGGLPDEWTLGGKVTQRRGTRCGLGCTPPATSPSPTHRWLASTGEGRNRYLKALTRWVTRMRRRLSWPRSTLRSDYPYGAPV